MVVAFDPRIGNFYDKRYVTFLVFLKINVCSNDSVLQSHHERVVIERTCALEYHYSHIDDFVFKMWGYAFVVLSFTDKIFRESEWFLDKVVHDAVVADVRVGGIFLKNTRLIQDEHGREVGSKGGGW